MSIKSVKIIGCGLIGTSIGLGLKEFGASISLEDVNDMNLALAKDLLGTSEASSISKPEIILIATPPQFIFEVIRDQYLVYPDAIFIEVSGIKSELIVQVEELSDVSQRFVSVHPMAGREKSGPQSARSDLFKSRAWIICETKNSSKRAVELAKEIGQILEASIYELDARTHDSVIASISHLPQILSSALGASLSGTEGKYLNLAGQGLRDVSRLADSDSELWTNLLAGNSEQVLPKLTEVINRLSNLQKSLESGDVQEIRSFMEDGKKGRELIPGKHGGVNRDYSYVPIVIDDKPGGLARIFNECAAIGVNVEDLVMEHSPGQEVGLITLALSSNDATLLQRHLVEKGWLAHAPRKNQ